jgi:hypothetical protein
MMHGWREPDRTSPMHSQISNKTTCRSFISKDGATPLSRLAIARALPTSPPPKCDDDDEDKLRRR